MREAAGSAIMCGETGGRFAPGSQAGAPSGDGGGPQGAARLGVRSGRGHVGGLPAQALAPRSAGATHGHQRT